MPFVPNFTVTQLSNLTSVTVEDTSTGTDGNIASRRIYFQEFGGAYLVPTGTTTDYVPYPLSGGATLLINNLLDRDYALNVTVVWLDISDNILYQLTILRGFSGYARYFLGQLTQYQISNRNLLYRRNYRESKLDCWQAVLSGDNAVSYMSDITNAQLCYNDAKYYIDHPELFY